MTLDLRLAVTDLVVGTVPIKVKCPDHIHKGRIGKLDKTQSLAVYDDHLHCFGCGFHLTQYRVELAGPTSQHPLAVLLGITNDEAVAQERRYDSDTLDAYRERAAENAQTDPLPFALAQVYHQMLTSGPRRQRLEWLYARGLSPKTLGQFLIGHDGNRFTIPVIDADGELLTFRYRRDDAYLDEKYPKYSGIAGRNGLYLFPQDEIMEHVGDTLFVCEGELDAMRLWQEGHPAITVTNGAGQVKRIPQLVRDRWPNVETLVFATDQDEAGQVAVLGHTNEQGKYTPGAAAVAQDLGFRTYQLQWDGAKDVTEAFQLGCFGERLAAHIAAIG